MNTSDVFDDAELILRSGGDSSLPRAITACVTHTERHGDALLFSIKVSEPGDGFVTFTVLRRHAQFEALHSALVARPWLAGRIPELPPLPGKHKAADDALVAARLSEWLRQVVADSELALLDEVRSTLELTAADQLTRKLRERESMYLELLAEKDRALEAQRRALCCLGRGGGEGVPMPAALSSLQAAVVGIEHLSDAFHATWWVFAIAVEYVGGEEPVSYTVKRRYREFRQLHSELRALAPSARRGLTLPELPGKSPLRAQDARFVLKRQALLHAYLQALLACDPLRCSRPLATFLRLEPPPDEGV